MAELWEGCPPRFTDDDSTLVDLKHDLESLGLLEGDCYSDALQIIRDVLRRADRHGATPADLARITGTGMHPGVFWCFLSWLCQWGILMRSDAPEMEGRFVVGPYGRGLLKGFRIYGCVADRWRPVPESALPLEGATKCPVCCAPPSIHEGKQICDDCGWGYDRL